MDIFDLPKKDQMSKDEMEILAQKQHEFKLVGRARKVPGHTMFCINLKTGEIKVAPVQRSKDVDFRTHEPVTRDRIVIEPDCLYRQALNRKNFIKRLVREGILIKMNKDLANETSHTT